MVMIGISREIIRLKNLVEIYSERIIELKDKLRIKIKR